MELPPLGPGARIIQVSAGDSHTVALASSGAVLAWGSFRDTSGSFGFVPTPAAPRSKLDRVALLPVVVWDPPAHEDRVRAIASGADHVVALTAGGEALTWGCAEKGRLGRLEGSQKLEDFVDRDSGLFKPGGAAAMARMLTPTKLPGLRHVVALGAGFFHSFAVTKSGDVYGWGLNNYGQLGLPNISNATTPPYFQARTAAACRGGAASPRARSPCAAAKPLNPPKPLRRAFYPEPRPAAAQPTRVPSLSGKGVVSITGGEHHTLALLRGGVAWSLGRPTYGRLGRAGADVAVLSDEPVEVPGQVDGFDGPVVQLAAGIAVSGAVTQSGAVYVWGFNGCNQLARGGDESDVLVPTRGACSRGAQCSRPSGCAVLGRLACPLRRGGRSSAPPAAPAVGASSRFSGTGARAVAFGGQCTAILGEPPLSSGGGKHEKKRRPDPDAGAEEWL